MVIHVIRLYCDVNSLSNYGKFKGARFSVTWLLFGRD
jgi:hypothetical protein